MALQPSPFDVLIPIGDIEDYGIGLFDVDML